jgi:hypothetical protein
MSDDTTETTVEPPTEDELLEDSVDERDEKVERAVQQANQFHQMMDQAKEWSREIAADLRVEAALEDEESVADQIEEIADLVNSVTTRIERGDNNRARQP